jgi:hypothetical protein
MLDEMQPHTFREWLAFDAMHPIGAVRDDSRAILVAAQKYGQIAAWSQPPRAYEVTDDDLDESEYEELLRAGRVWAGRHNAAAVDQAEH